MLTLFAPLTKSQLRALQNNNLQLKTTIMRGHSALKCHPSVHALGLKFEVSLGPSCVHYPVLPSSPVLYSCPFGHGRPSQWPFDYMDRHKSIYCTMCRKAFIGAQWACHCQHVWHT
eukprot:8583039-Karenia_brevis.AAC.1